MSSEVAVLRYSRWIIPQALVILLVGIFGIWICFARTPPTSLGKLVWGTLSVYPLMVAVTGLYRLGDEIEVTEQFIIRQGWIRKAHIPWDEVIEVSRYCLPFEDCGIKIISRSGQVIVLTESLPGFFNLFGYIKHRVPDKFSKRMRQIAGLKTNSAAIKPS